MRIFITGGTGFIGKEVVNLLGNQTLMLSKRLSNIKDWEDELIEFDPEVCIHMAWEGIPDYSKKQSLINLDYGINLYRSISKTNCKKIITTGSCWEYNDTRNPFIDSKDLLYRYGKYMFPGTFIWTRLFYVYGVNQKEDSLIPSVVSSLNSEEAPKIKSPNSYHDFVNVKDVAKAIVDLIYVDESGIYDIGSGHLTQVKDIVANIYNIKKDTGWEPSEDLECSLKEILESKYG